MEDEKMTIFARRVVELRKEKKLTQAQLADMVGVAKTSLCFYEQAERIPDLQVLVKFTRALGVTSDYLIGITDNRKGEYSSEAQGSATKRNYEFAIRTEQGGKLILACDTTTDLQELFDRWNEMIYVASGKKSSENTD